MLSRVTAKNVGDVFLRLGVYSVFCGELDVRSIRYKVQLKFLTEVCNINCLSLIPCCIKLFVSNNALLICVIS